MNGTEPFAIPPEVAFSTTYDVAIVGSGVSGALIAKTLGANGLKVLVVEAGFGEDVTISDYSKSVERFYSQVSKDNNAPYAHSRNAPMPRDYDAIKLRDGKPNDKGYLVQNGPFEIDSTYSRVLGGTTRHWEAKALRMLPDDFKMQSAFGRGRDWPISYESLSADYARAERELGVSGNVEDQEYGGLTFEDGYVYPMKRMPPSFLDKAIAKDIDGFEIEVGGETFELHVRSTPQARNGIPNPAYDGGKGFVPKGAVSIHQAEMGGRCQGNTNCVPICPVQAKYDARRTLLSAMDSGNVHLLPRTVASRVEVDGTTGQVTGVSCKTYKDKDALDHTIGRLKARIFVLAANAVENARIMLASDLHGSSRLVGRNLMDHAYLLTWGLMPEIVGTGRGPLCTSGIEDIRTGAYRKHHAAVRFSIHNDGWGWATGSPYTDLAELVDTHNLTGRALRNGLIARVGRQVLLDCMIEVLPEETNRISVDPAYIDQMGNPRPVISFDIPAYTLETASFSRRLTRRIYQRLGAEDHTAYDPLAPGWVTHEGEGFTLRGGNHWAGTHIMGSDARTSVVDAAQRSWDHKNLYLAGAGSMPSIGTANTTLTLAALCLRTADAIITEFAAGKNASQMSNASQGVTA